MTVIYYIILNKSSSSIIDILPATHPHGSNLINSKLLEYSVFYGGDTLIELGLS